MCFGMPEAPDVKQSAPQATPTAKAPDNTQTGEGAGASARKRAMAAGGLGSTIATGGGGLSNQIASTTKTSKGLLG